MRQTFPAEIIDRVRNGDSRAFAAVVDSFRTSVYNLCYRMLNNISGDAEDAVQEVFVKVWRNIDKYDEQRTFSTWVLSIATNHCIDQIRKRRLPTVEIDETMEEVIPDRIPSPKRIVAEREKAEQVRILLDGLSEIDRAIIILRYWDDLSDREIGLAVGLSEAAVKSRLFRARKQLVGFYRQAQEQAVMEAA